MSTRYMQSVMGILPTHANTQLVLIHLAYDAGEGGATCIELSRLAKKCKLSLRAVSSAIKRLEREGRILVTILPHEPTIYEVVLPYPC